MSAVNLLSTFKEEPTDEVFNDGSKYEGDEEPRGDPAVLAMGPVRRALVYTREELMRLRNSPLVRQGLENAFAGHETLALVLKKRSDSPNEDDRGARGDAPMENNKGVYCAVRGERRSADPRERVRKESEPSGATGAAGGIVLSPQRRSFTSGCGAPAAPAPPAPPHVARTRPDSPLAAPPHNAKPDQVRRIGSGRLNMRDIAAAPWEREDGEREYRDREPYRPPAAGREREERTVPRSNNDRFERRSFARDNFSSDMRRERDDRFNKDRIHREDRRSGGRYSQRRFENEAEPEWVSGGPTSQLETIELRGFDEPIKRNGTTDSKHSEKWSGGSKSPTERWRDPPARSPSAPADPPPPSAPTAPAPAPAAAPASDTHSDTHDKDNGGDNKTSEELSAPPVDHSELFNYEDFLKLDTLPEMLTNGTSDGEGGGSRFSRWFQRSESPTHHYEKILHNIVDELESSSPPEPPPAHVFAPISPAPPPSLLELLRRANAAGDHAHSHAHHQPQHGGHDNTVNASGPGGKIHSLEELEARLRAQHPPPPPPPLQADHDLTAFKRLLAQVSGGHAVTAEPQPQPQPQPQTHQQPLSLLQMFNKSVEQQKAQQPPHIPQELLYKLLQVQRQQQEMQSGMQQPQQQQNSAPPAERDLLQRPEAVALIQGLKSGELTVQHVMQQLNNPGLQSRHRELLHAVLRLHHHPRQMGGSPLPVAPHLVVPSHHQPLSISPLPHSAFCVSPIMATSPNTLGVHHTAVPARIPSPRELAAHTQSIMQGALIKKKLEEQRENYRRRHEHHHAKQATPISFTPTSVLRKMTAEKEVEPPSPKQQWNQPPKMPQGRPIVKGNQSGVSSSMGYAPSAADYQQHYMSQQQQLSGGRPFPHQQQRQSVPPTLNSLSSMSNMNSISGMNSIGNMTSMNSLSGMSNYGMNSMNNMNNVNSMNMTRGVAAGTTLHQLIVQSHQRTMNELGGGAGGAGGGAAGGGDNQLARWFSPELLARASAGKLPSVHVPNALSLEELERGHGPVPPRAHHPHHPHHPHHAHHSPAVRN